MTELRAVIFDMDGLLIDSEPLWLRVEMEVFGDVGVALDEHDCARTKGLRTDDIVAFWHERHPWSTPSRAETEARLVARMGERIRAEGRALPGVARAIEAAKAHGRKIALASSSPYALIEAALDRLALVGVFDVVQSAESEPLGKPHPGIFLTTAARLGVPATECLVLEDSLTGVIAAKAARMAVVAVPMDHPDHDARFVLADGVVGSLAEVTDELVTAIARART